ncbi:MAG: hypothetical protein HPY52_13950 [Firmicutes bacterium]|nr:hypothetical protein [Bacillota bacterium]
MDSNSRLLEAIQVFLLVTGYMLVGGCAAFILHVGLAQWLFFSVHLFAGVILLEVTMTMAGKLSLVRAPSLVFMLMTSLYYVVSSVKYFAGLEVYRQFAISDQDRFLGSVAVFGVSLLCLVVIRLLAKRLRPILDQRYLAGMVERLPRAFQLILIVDVVTKLFLVYTGYGPTYIPGRYSIVAVRMYWDLLLLTTSSIMSDLVQILGAALIATSKRAHRPGMLLPIAGLGLELAWALFMRSRSLILFPLVAVGVCLFLLRPLRIARVYLRWLVFAVFVVGTLGSTAVLTLLGRAYVEGGNALYASVAEMGYRLDLSDFAVAYMTHNQGMSPHLGIVEEAIMNIIPRGLWPTKTLFGQYAGLFAGMGWPSIDYTDTLFSSGALVGGWLGFILVPLAFLALVEVGYRLVLQYVRRLGADLVPVISYLYLLVNMFRVELGWFELFLYLRSSLIGLTIIFVIGMVARLRLKRGGYESVGTEVTSN